jgi:hypothetical protein
MGIISIPTGYTTYYLTKNSVNTKGDRIWYFALSIYLIEINKSTLRMNAISGFTCSVVIVLFGATVGTLVDRYQRLSGKPWVKMHLSLSCSLFFIFFSHRSREGFLSSAKRIRCAELYDCSVHHGIQ